MDTIKLELSKQLAASCCCLTKTNEPKYHDELCYYRLLMEKAAVDKPEVVLSNSTKLLSCKRWHEAEIIALKKLLADENADDTLLAKSMRTNFRYKIAQHETYIKALVAVTT